MQIVLILLGMALGAAVGSGGAGFVLGGVVGWLLARSLRQQREIDGLTQRLALARLEQPATVAEPADMAAEPDASAAGGEAAASPAFPASSASAAVSALSVPSTSISSTAFLAPAPPAAPAEPAPAWEMPATTPGDVERRRPETSMAPSPPGVFDAVIASARAWLFGGNTIVKAGVAILFIGLAFLAKFASEHVQLPVELRLAGIAAVAIVLLVLGWRLRLRRAGYAQVLQGGAIAVLYLTLFAAFKFYGVVSAGPAFVLMAAVAVLAAALAVLQDARALAAVGAIGGYATPLLLSSGSGNAAALFSYYLVLGGGVVAVAWWRTWRELNLIAFAFTFGVGSAWGLFGYQSDDYALAQTFLALFFLLFVVVLLLPARRASEVEVPAGAGEAADGRSARWINGSLLFGLPTVVFGLQYGLVQHMAFGPALSAFVLAAFYVGLARALHGKPHLALAFEGCLAVGTVLLTLVIPLALDQRSTAGAWALEGAGLIWLGFRQHRRLPRALGYGLIVVAGFLLLHAIDHHTPERWLNPTLLAGLMLVAGALVAAFVVQRFAHPAASGSQVSERVAEPLLIGWALFALVPLVWLHLRALVEAPLRLSVLIACVAVLALGFTALSRRLVWRGIVLPVLALAPLLLVFALAGIDWQAQPFAQGGWWAWPLALAAHGVALRWAAPQWPAAGTRAAHVLGALVVAVLGAATGRGLLDAATAETASAWPWLGWLAVPALLLALLPWPRFATAWPLREAPAAYTRDAGLLLSASALLWTLLANVISNGAAAPLPYLPFINPLDIGIALALAAAARWMFAPGPGAVVLRAKPAAAPAALGVCVFIWLNAMLVRAFHHLGDVPFRVSSWSASLAVQTGLTLLWTTTALALMWWSARRALRTPWMVGAALLGLVVLKLLLVDLSASGTVTRIVSFIGAGVLMLVIGYVAPLPARTAGGESKADEGAGGVDART